MSNDNIYSRLTPAAREAVDELSGQFKDTLIEKAYQLAIARNTADREVSLKDIMDANILLTRPTPDRTLEKRQYFQKMVTLGGILYAIVGFAIYIYHNKKFALDSDNLGIAIGVVGLLIALSADTIGQILMGVLVHKGTFKSDDLILVKSWQLIESLARTLMPDTEKKEIAFIIRFLSHRVAKDEKEYQKIRELLRLRNKIVHEGYRLSTSEQKRYIEFADELITRLKNAQRETSEVASIKVIKATYGTKNNSIDISDQLKELITNNRLEFVISNEIAGDPDHGVVKDFEITYELNGKKITKTFKEGEKVSIPE